MHTKFYIYNEPREERGKRRGRKRKRGSGEGENGEEEEEEEDKKKAFFLKHFLKKILLIYF